MNGPLLLTLDYCYRVERDSGAFELCQIKVSMLKPFTPSPPSSHASSSYPLSPLSPLLPSYLVYRELLEQALSQPNL